MGDSHLGIRDARFTDMNRFAQVRLCIPPGRYVAHALELQRSEDLRSRLRRAPVVLSVQLDGTQEVLWGAERLHEGHVRGESSVEVAVFRVTDEDDCAFLI